jgi:hypothetical protein
MNYSSVFLKLVPTHCLTAIYITVFFFKEGFPCKLGDERRSITHELSMMNTISTSYIVSVINCSICLIDFFSYVAMETTK